MAKKNKSSSNKRRKIRRNNRIKQQSQLLSIVELSSDKKGEYESEIAAFNTCFDISDTQRKPPQPVSIESLNVTKILVPADNDQNGKKEFMKKLEGYPGAYIDAAMGCSDKDKSQMQEFMNAINSKLSTISTASSSRRLQKLKDTKFICNCKIALITINFKLYRASGEKKVDYLITSLKE